MASAVPTDKDTMFFFHVLLNLKGPKTPDTDWDVVASAMNLKSVGVAKTRFGQIKRKFESTSGDTPAKVTPAKAATPSKRKKAAPKKKAVSDDDDESPDDQPGTPSKKPKIKAEPEPEPEPESEEPEFGKEP